MPAQPFRISLNWQARHCSVFLLNFSSIPSNTGLLCITLCACGARLVRLHFQHKSGIRRNIWSNLLTSVLGWKSFEDWIEMAWLLALRSSLNLDISNTDNRAATTKEVNK